MKDAASLYLQTVLWLKKRCVCILAVLPVSIVIYFGALENMHSIVCPQDPILTIIKAAHEGV